MSYDQGTADVEAENRLLNERVADLKRRLAGYEETIARYVDAEAVLTAQRDEARALADIRGHLLEEARTKLERAQQAGRDVEDRVFQAFADDIDLNSMTTGEITRLVMDAIEGGDRHDA